MRFRKQLQHILMILCVQIGSFNPSLRPPETFFKVIFWLGYFNSCLNPIIYPCYSREFKQVIHRLYQVCCFLGTPQQLSVVFFPLRPLFGSSDASGNGSASDGRRTPTTAAIRALTIHPSWTAASRRCPPSAPARSMLPPDVTLQHGPTPPVESFTRDPREEVGPVRCPGLLRTRGQA